MPPAVVRFVRHQARGGDLVVVTCLAAVLLIKKHENGATVFRCFNRLSVNACVYV